jgi:periplasmic protein TonB
MRKYTLAFSVIAHAAAIAAAIIVPALATDELPELRHTTSFTIVQPVMPDPMPVSPTRTGTAPTSSPIPLKPPDGVQPEPEVERNDPVTLAIPSPTGSGVPFSGEPVIGGELVPPPTPPRPKEPMPVGGLILPPKKIVHVAPVYPAIALAAGKPGMVILQAVISEDGTVREVKVLRSDPLFDQAAMEAVKQWRFTTPMLNGQPIPVVMTVTVGFTLNR